MLKLTTWNLLAPGYTSNTPYSHIYDRVRAEVDWSVRRGRLREALRTETADILCVQEVAPDLFDGAEDPLGDGVWQMACAPRPSTHTESHVAVLWRRGKLEAEPTHGGLEGEFGASLAVRLSCVDSGRSLALVSVHLRYDRDPSVRSSRLEAVIKHLRCVARADASLVVGDVNFDPVAHPRWPRWRGAGWQSTHPGETIVTWGVNGRTEKLDAILFRGALSLRHAEPVLRFDPKLGLPSAALPSDHVPLRATFEWGSR